MASHHFLQTLTELEPGNHLCCLYETEEEHLTSLTPFLRQGLERGEKVIYIRDDHNAGIVQGYLQDSGMPVESYLTSGQLNFQTVDDTYMRGGVFDSEKMIALLQASTKRAIDEGYTALRATGEMSWALRGLPGSEGLIEYESKLNEFLPGSRCLAMCQYDRRTFDPTMLLDVLRTHPLCALGTEIYDSFYYLPPAEFLGNGHSKETLHSWLTHMTEHKRTKEALRTAKEELNASEEISRVLAENVADAVMLVQDGRLAFVNDAFVSMFDYISRTQVVGKSLSVLNRPCLTERFSKENESLEARASNKKMFQVQCIATDGRKFWVEAHHNNIKWEGKPAVLVTLRDITETKLQQIAIAEEKKHLHTENIKLKSTIKDHCRFGDIIGRSPVMQELYELILKAGAFDASVVIYGESGTGKELIARTIHNMSEHHNKSFVPVNCEAIPETLFESEFFGHRKAAFAGAYGAKHGFFALCHEGVLFLDKVNELSLSMQVKLIGAIEGSGYTPVGDNKFRNADVRIIATTTRNLADMVKKGLMREDFFYRIYIIPITVPPLRDRKEDIPLLVDHFLNFHHRGNNPSKIPEKIIETLYDHDWPGNVRELQNVLQRYIAIKRLDLTGAQKTRPVDMCNVSAAELDKEDVELHGAQETFEKNFDCPYPESESLAQS